MIRKVVGLLTGLVCWMTVYAQSYIPVDDSSRVAFSIKNLGIKVQGVFTGLEGSIYFDPSQLEKSLFDVSIEAASVNTGNHKRDEHLCKAVFFDCQNHPRIKFVSVKVGRGKKAGTFFMDGTLTIKGYSLPVSFPFSVKPVADGYWMEGEFRMRRKPYTVGRTSTLSNKLTVHLKVLAKKA